MAKQEDVHGFMNDNGPLTSRVRDFYLWKTIQRSYNFMVMFDESIGLPEQDDLGVFVATSVEIPDYSFKKEVYRAGPFVKNFAVLDHEGFNITMKMEETDTGRVKSLIQKLIHKNIKPTGYYNTYENTIIPQIVVDVYRQNGDNVYKLRFKNCFFLKASTPTYTYNSNEKIEYDLEFACDHYELEPRNGAVNTYEGINDY